MKDAYIKPKNRLELEKLIEKKELKNQDLRTLDLNGVDFSGCSLTNVLFSSSDSEGMVLRNMNFQHARLESVFFEHCELHNCNFDKNDTVLKRVSFKNSTLNKCRFRAASIYWSDMRYAEISFATFEDAFIQYTDFYRTMFIGINLFKHSSFNRCSFNHTYFDEGSGFRKDQLYKNRILPEQKQAYRVFLKSWPEKGPGIRTNTSNEVSDWQVEQSLRNRYHEAEEIYKGFNGLWNSKGFLSDSNWAYVKGKRMERKAMLSDLLYGKWNISSLALLPKILWNGTVDMLFGYGESMRKMIFTYILTVILFAFFYYAAPEVNIREYTEAFRISLKNMVAMTPDKITGISPFVDMLNILQTSVGILITGIFGFILGNKIRNT